MSLQIHRAERADRLVAALGELLSQPLRDPFAGEVVAVPTPGVERWLAQHLAGQLGAAAGGADGVCAGVDFPSTQRLVHRAVAGSAGAEEEDPWRPSRALWPLLAVIDGCRGQEWAALLWRHLGDDDVSGHHALRRGRRWSTARHLAGLFARYAAARPAMVQAWAAGRDVDGDGAPLAPDRAWQAELWRRLRAELDVPSPVERLESGAARLREAPGHSDLPERLSVFGPTRLEPQHVAVLAALAEHRDVHLWLPHPSPALWDAVAAHVSPSPTAGSAAGPALPRRADDRTDQLAEHRLLAYLGRDSRELEVVLGAAAAVRVDTHHPAPPGPTGAGAPRPSLLHRLQADITANRGPVPLERRPALTAGDTSVRLHSCHGPDRQVEVLREVLVGLLADDPSLEPRDIVVLCPDIETFAPLVAATFGLDTDDAVAEHPGHRLRVRLADRSLRQVNPLLSVLNRVVQLAGSRMESTALLDLLATPPVARRFGFSAEDLERLRALTAQSGVRWGLDAGHRAGFGMADFGQNTWSAGLDRLLLGVTMDESEHHFLGTALPLDDVDSADVDLVGRLAEFVARLAAVTDRCAQPQALASWVLLLREALELLTAVPANESWQVGHAQAELSRLTETAGDGAGAELSLPEVAALLTEAFRGRPGRSNFRTGTLTMCTMHPMRSIPHRVVCLLGVDDGVFPRRQRADGDDIAALDQRVGDADPRSEDRQLLLDAVMSAQEHLVVVHAGSDPRTGTPVPPAVPVGELLDALDLTARAPEGRRVRDVVTVHHRLQPFDPANFSRGGLEPGTGRAPVPDGVAAADAGRPFSFDRAALRGARRTQSARTPPAPVFDRRPLVPLPAGSPVELAELTRFFRHPLRALLRQRAGISLYADDDGPDEQIPVDLDGLQRWEIGERLLELHLQGTELALLQAAEWRRGLLPPRAFGGQVLDQVSEQVAAVRGAAAPFLVAPPQKVEVATRLGDRPLVGTLGHARGDDLVQVSFSSLSARHRLQGWIELLAVTVAHPERPWRAVTVARRGLSVLGPVEPEWAQRWLSSLVGLYDVGLREPLPFAPKTSALYATIRSRGIDLGPPQWRDLAKEWRQEGDETYARFFDPEPHPRSAVELEALLAEPARPGEELATFVEPTRFGTVARRVFHPLLWMADRS